MAVHWSDLMSNMMKLPAVKMRMIALEAIKGHILRKSKLSNSVIIGFIFTSLIHKAPRLWQ